MTYHFFSLRFSGPNLDKTITLLRVGLKQLNEWCKLNRLYINWSKTYLMIITNKRVNMPKSIDFDDISIEVVDHFKLLGVTIDNKLQFNKFVMLTNK
jgi:hypothetical protein